MKGRIISRRRNLRSGYKMKRNFIKRKYRFPRKYQEEYFVYKRRKFNNGKRRLKFRFSRKSKGNLTNEKLNKELDNYFKKNEKKDKNETDVEMKKEEDNKDNKDNKDENKKEEIKEIKKEE